MEIKAVLLIIHLFAVIFGAGAAFTGDNIFFLSIKDRSISKDEFKFIKLAGRLVWIGLVLMFLSGFAMFLLDVDKYLNSSKFLLKMVIVAVIVINGLVFHLVHMKFFENFLDKDLSLPDFQKRKKFIFASGGISAVSWMSAILLGSLRSIPMSLSQGLLVYTGILLVAVAASQVVAHRFK